MKNLNSLIFAAALSLFAVKESQAQIQEGNFMVGANLADFDLGFQNNNTQFSMSINPKIGYFIQDNVVLGGQFKLGIDAAKNTFGINYGIGAFGRYYIGDPRAVVLRHARFFLEADAGIAGTNHKVTGIPAASTNGLGLGVGPGVAYFITPNIGLEALLKYNSIVGFGTSPTSGNLNLGIGFQIYIPSSKARDVYREAASEAEQRYR